MLACLDGKVLVTCHQHDRSNNANEAIREIAEQIGRISLHVTIRTLLYVVCIEAERARALCSKIWESATFLSNDSRDLP